MKKIAVTQRIVEDNSTKEIRDALDQRWSKFLHELNMLPILLPGDCDFKTYFSDVKIDGILFTGGNDLSIFSNSPVDKLRDEFESELIAFGLNNKIPMIGICRGMQVISRFFNEEVVQVNNHTGIRHKIKFINDAYSRSQKELEVNSFHNFGIINISDNFIIHAKSDDGVIEAIEHKENRIYAQMWHPEREKIFSEYDLAIFRSFLVR